MRVLPQGEVVYRVNPTEIGFTFPKPYFFELFTYTSKTIARVCLGKEEDVGMNTKKYGAGNAGLLDEADRSLYRDAQGEMKDNVSKSRIDSERTSLNYNLCSHDQYTKGEIMAMQRELRGKEMRKDGVLFGSTIITLPKDFSGDSRAFFQSAYDNVRVR